MPQLDSPVPPTSHVLMALSKHIAIRCKQQNLAFMTCKEADENPEACLVQGREVQKCVYDLIKEVHGAHPEDFGAFTKCMDYYTNKIEKCRKEQKAFEDACPPSPTSS